MKEIEYAEENKATESDLNEPKHEKGHSSNSIFTDSKDEEFEEFTEVLDTTSRCIVWVGRAATPEKEQTGSAGWTRVQGQAPMLSWLMV